MSWPPLAIENRSPWLEQLPDRPAAPAIDADTEVDVAIVGAGIAGVATAWFALRDTERSVLLLERDRIASGATGHSAGQIAGYFERPFCELAAEFGLERAASAQRGVLEAWELLDQMVREVGAADPPLRLVGHMGMFTLEQVSVHLENNRLREQAGLQRERIRVADGAAYLGAIPRRYSHLYEIAPASLLHELLETDHPRYTAVLSEPKACTNAALLCEHVVAHLQRAYGPRFRLAEQSPVQQIELCSGGATLAVGKHRVRAARVVLCSNGFDDHSIVDGAGPRPGDRVTPTIGFMAAFLEPLRAPAALSFLASPRIGQGPAYFYVTRRPFRVEGRELTLTAIGGPDAALADPRMYDPRMPYPRDVLQRLDEFIRPIIAPGHSAPLDYAYAWHGLMAYTPGQVRSVGADPRDPALLYNLGCNGVGLLPSIHGGWRVARLLAGERLAPSLFDPR